MVLPIMRQLKGKPVECRRGPATVTGSPVILSHCFIKREGSNRMIIWSQETCHEGRCRYTYEDKKVLNLSY